MKFGKSVLLEIVDLFRDGILTGNDISQALREIDLVANNGTLELSPEYIKSHPRAGDWGEYQ